VLGIITSPSWVNDWHNNAIVYMMILMSGVLSRMREMELMRDQAVARSVAAELRAEVASAQKEEKSKFLSLMAHELKTPLAIIDAAVQALGYGNPQAPPAARRRHQRIRDAVARLNTLLEDSLRVARNEKNQPAVFASPEPVDMNVLEQALRHHLPVEAAQGPATVHFEFEPGLHLQADGMLLRRAVGNLVDNAVKYGAPGQPITVRARRQPHSDQPGVAFEVVSAFTGDATEDCEAWFGKHHRGKNSQAQEGMGLGLYLVRAIAEAHDGHAHCRLHPRGGDSMPPSLVAALWLPSPMKDSTR
jgi:signal transduction histidine kinase